TSAPRCCSRRSCRGRPYTCASPGPSRAPTSTGCACTRRAFTASTPSRSAFHRAARGRSSKGASDRRALPSGAPSEPGEALPPGSGPPGTGLRGQSPRSNLRRRSRRANAALLRRVRNEIAAAPSERTQDGRVPICRRSPTPSSRWSSGSSLSMRPRPVAVTIEPADAAEARLAEAARLRREHRLARFAQKAARLRDTTPEPDADVRWRFESARSVLPEDALFGNTMFVGKLLMALDEAGGILSMRYCKGPVMTACLDALDFYSPIFTHEVVTFRAGLNHVGNASLEIGVKVLTEVPWSGAVRHACTAFLTYVH